MTEQKIWVPKPRFNVSSWDEPKNDADRAKLCGVALKEIEPYWDSAEAAAAHPTFFIAGATTERADTVRGWDIFREITGFDPPTIPQPTGNCVAAASEEIVELTQCVDIKKGDREQFKDLMNAYHYAYGRVIIGKNRLRGGPGSIGGWQARAHTEGGVLPLDHAPDLPAYNKRNVDRWGDDKDVDGKSFRDYIEVANDFLIKTTSRINTMTELFDALSNNHYCTIASNRGYSKKPKGGKRGYHYPSGSWSHQMGIWGYSISHDWIAIKNQWGRRIHGELEDLETGEPWPPGFLRVRLEDFEKKHLRGAECIAYSRFEGFPEQRFDHASLG